MRKIADWIEESEEEFERVADRLDDEEVELEKRREGELVRLRKQKDKKLAEYKNQSMARPGMNAKKAEDMKQYMTSSRHLQSPLPAIAEVPGLSAGEGRQAEVGGPPHRKAG